MNECNALRIGVTIGAAFAAAYCMCLLSPALLYNSAPHPCNDPALDQEGSKGHRWTRLPDAQAKVKEAAGCHQKGPPELPVYRQLRAI